jgi:hypothetical protein
VAFYNDEVALLKPPMRANRAGEQRPDYTGLADAEGVPWRAVQVRPLSQAELPGEDRETALSSWRIASRPGTPVPDVDNIDWIRLPDGTVTQVVGDIARPSDPVRGGTHHVELTVERANR